MCDVCKSHMWIARCFDLIFTTIKTKKKKLGVTPKGRRDPHPYPGGRPQHSDSLVASGNFSPLLRVRVSPHSRKRGPFRACASVRSVEKNYRLQNSTRKQQNQN